MTCLPRVNGSQLIDNKFTVSLHLFVLCLYVNRQTASQEVSLLICSKQEALAIGIQNKVTSFPLSIVAGSKIGLNN
jgi:hypothetical protein